MFAGFSDGPALPVELNVPHQSGIHSLIIVALEQTMIDAEQVSKSFDGRRALDGFTLHVGAGELFGLVGPNGAGKTTLMKVLSTLLPMDSGTAQIGGLK